MFKIEQSIANNRNNNYATKGDEELDPLVAYKKELDRQIKKGRKFLDVDQVDLRALKNRLEVTCVCDLVGLYIGHEKENNLEKLKENLQKSLVSAQRTERLMTRLKVAAELEVCYFL